MTVPIVARASILLLVANAAFAASAPTADTLKQVLTQRLMQLKPDSGKERNVLFGDVRAGASNGTSYPFIVNAVVRDYSAGYPANRFYGETCVSRFEKAAFTLMADANGGWILDGALTPPMSATRCQANPSAGVSSIPLATLQGTQATAGTPVQSSGTSAGAVAAGGYECWSSGQPRLLLNFTIRSASQYIGSDGKAGSYSFDAATKRIKFSGGALDGVMPAGFYAIYHAPQGHPTVSFQSPRGAEASYCEKVR